MSLIYPLLGDRRVLYRSPQYALRPAHGFHSPDEVMDLANFANNFLSNYLEGAEPKLRSSGSQLTKKGFEVKLDVTGFKPEELEVKTVDKCIVITGKHEEKQDEHGFISRSFSRRYVLPDTVKQDSVNCSMTSDGFLLLSAPVITPMVENERPIPIIQTGKPAPAIESADEAKMSNGPAE